MTNGYVLAGYSVSIAIIGAYAWRIIHRGRALRRALPPQGTDAPAGDQVA